MNTRFTFLFLFVFTFAFSQQENKAYKTYSYSQLFQMIEEEQDSIFKLEDAIIEVNPKTDKKYLGYFKIGNRDSIYTYNKKKIEINKEIQLTNVQFPEYFNSNEDTIEISGLTHIIFNKKASFRNTFNLEIRDCLFNDLFEFGILDFNDSSKKAFENYAANYNNGRIRFTNNTFLHRTFINVSSSKKNDVIDVSVVNNHFSNLQGKNERMGFFNIGFVIVNNNVFNSNGYYDIKMEQIQHGMIEGNLFSTGLSSITCIEIEELFFTDNLIETEVLLDFSVYNSLTSIGSNQFKTPFSSNKGYDKLLSKVVRDYRNINHDSLFQIYKTQYKVQDETTFNYEMEQKSEFYNYYKSKFNTKAANKLYVEMKDLETERLQYLFKQNPSFDTFFTYKINQFLYVFSAYGTRPSKAIIFSLYVILFFAFIYLFFPNSWDKHGRKRLVDRYTFFFKYMDNKAGIHEVYLEDNKQDLLEFQEFKDIIDSKTKKVPRLFTATALPLYKWAISGTKLSASILKRIDIMKGTWSELPKSKRIWKSVLLIGAFTIAVIYDIFIKMLNALMLSINTFTTLGFGEIPIKGLPRYLAIIQGFIGWFMLTIFSVSLISQLLN